MCSIPLLLLLLLFETPLLEVERRMGNALIVKKGSLSSFQVNVRIPLWQCFQLETLPESMTSFYWCYGLDGVPSKFIG